MKYYALLWAFISLLSGCQHVNLPSYSQPQCAGTGDCIQVSAKDAVVSSEQTDKKQSTAAFGFETMAYSNKQLADYASQMSMQLVDTMYGFYAGSGIAVASFVELGAGLDQSNMLGNQLAETFMHQLQQYGLAVIDYKTSKSIALTPQGDFVFSRDIKRLQSQQMIDYVLSGTMMYTPRGVMVNARIIHFQHKTVVASAQQLIPHFVVSALYSEHSDLAHN